MTVKTAITANRAEVNEAGNLVVKFDAPKDALMFEAGKPFSIVLPPSLSAAIRNVAR